MRVRLVRKQVVKFCCNYIYVPPLLHTMLIKTVKEIVDEAKRLGISVRSENGRIIVDERTLLLIDEVSVSKRAKYDPATRALSLIEKYEINYTIYIPYFLEKYSQLRQLVSRLKMLLKAIKRVADNEAYAECLSFELERVLEEKEVELKKKYVLKIGNDTDEVTKVQLEKLLGRVKKHAKRITIAAYPAEWVRYSESTNIHSIEYIDTSRGIDIAVLRTRLKTTGKDMYWIVELALQREVPSLVKELLTIQG